MPHSENPTAATYVRQMEEVWDAAFVLAKRILKKHEPDKFGEDSHGHYMSSMPMIANEIVHQLVGASQFMRTCPEQEKDRIFVSMDAVIKEMKVLEEESE